MGELLIKPYEISVWEDKLTQNGFIENKLAVIGSNTMDGPNKVYDPVFTKRVNGEKTLTFSLKYKYFDPYIGNEEVVNPFAALLVNERKVKLKYDDQWYEFIVKDHTESSDELTWTYTCTDAFVLELSKNGYNITFDAELNNNQGTASELAEETLKNTDWRLGGSNVGKQLIAEPIYKARLESDTVEIINASGDSTTTPQAGADIYVFYSYIKNKNGRFVQFIIRDNNREYTIDDKNVITDTNFRITTELSYDEKSQDNEIIKGFWLDSTLIISLDEVETKYQANRLVYNQLTTYDPVTERTVDIFKANDREVYKYTDYTYTTSNVVMNYITNGDNFNLLEDGSLQGWNPYVDFTRASEDDKIDKLELVTYPELGTGKELADISKLSQIEGFLKAQFKGPLTVDYKNAIYNSGVENQASFIESISLGQKFVFRWRAGVGELGSLQPDQNLRLLVAKYTRDDPTRYGYYYRYIDADNIILRFNGTPQILNNIIKGGSLVQESETGNYNYVIDNVVQTPSTKYIYVNSVDNQEYVWTGENGQFELKTNNNYLPYYYLTAEAQKAVSSGELKDPTEKIGIFIYSIDDTISNHPIYIQDIQFTRFVPDSDGETPILIGNIPTATSNTTDYYYLKPAKDTTAEEIQTYTSVSALAEVLGVTENDIVPVYNEDSTKILSISASQSNCFNILQTIAETFECWVDLVVSHDDQGYITYSDGKPDKFVYLREFIGKDNWAGFKYGINLQSVERTVNSDEIVTKLIVDQSQSDYVDEGFVSIANAPSNQSGESYIINFDYYYNQSLLDRDVAEADKLNFIAATAEKNNELRQKEKQRRDLEASLTALNSNRTVFTELVSSAQDAQSEALADFEQLTGQTYEDYKEEHLTLEEEDQLTEEETIVDVLGKLYVSSATINNYSGLLTNINQEYWNIREQLRGSENYKVKFWSMLDANEQNHIIVELNDYLPGLQFQLGQTYTDEFTISKKYFDILSDEDSISFMPITGFNFEPAQSSYSITTSPQIVQILNTENKVGIEDEIEQLLEEKEELTTEFNNKYRRFIQEGTWNSTEYIDSELYYLDAVQVSNTSAQPTVSYTIGVVEVSELEGLEWYLFDVGDKTYIEDTEFFGWSNQNGVLTPAREEVIVSEVEWHLEQPDQNVITIQNYKTRFEDLFQRISAAVQTVQYNEATYAKISSLLDADGTINQDVLLESLNRISGQTYNLTSDGSVLINGDQILIQNLTNPANRVIITSEGIKVSSDGGLNWRIALDGQGINAGVVTAGNINTHSVIIGSSDNPSFRWDKSGISAYRSNINTGKYDLQTYVRYDEYGLYGIKKDIGSFKAQSLQDIKDNAHFAVTWDGFFIKNSYTGGGKVQITSENDFQVINADQSEKIKIGALEWTQDGVITTTPIPGVAPSLYGIRIKNNAGDVVMQTDDDGNLQITGDISATTGHIGGMVVNNDSLQMVHIILEPGVGIYSDILTENNEPIFIISDTDGSAVFNEITARGHIEAQTGTLGLLTVQDTITVGDSTHNGIIQSNGYVTGSTGWAIKSNGTAEFQDATVRGHIDATSGTLNNLNITGGITVVSNGYIKSNNFDANGNTGWKITDTGAVFNNVTARGHIEAATGTLGDLDVIDTITVGANGAIESSNYSTVNHTGWHIDDTSATFNNANVRGTITALQGDFLGAVRVGPTSQGQDHIIIDGANALIRSSNYQDGAGYGWMINKDGDAVFNNITARGAIRTAVFEYAEIQAVGGIFIFRPSSTIREAVIAPNETDLIITVEKPYLFEVGAWCKISNYIDDGADPDVRVNNILLTNGLTHVYRVSAANGKVVTLAGAAAMVEGAEAVVDIDSLVGGALIDMGNKANGNGEVGTHNYGIGINSSDNTVNLPARAITLFETIIDENRSPKVSYKYRGILGTLPNLPVDDVKQNIYPLYMAGKQGIYTDNMYIGDNQQYIAFYTDTDDLDEDQKPKKKLRISAKEMVFGYDPDTGEEITWEEKIEEASQGADAIYVVVDSTAGNFFQHGQVNTYLVAHVYRGSEDVTSEFSTFHWYRRLPNGNVDPTWSTQETSNLLQLTTADVDERAVFVCEVTIA